MSIVVRIALLADLDDQPVDGRPLARKQIETVSDLELGLDERLGEIPRQECREGEPGRAREDRQHRADAHRHDDQVAAFLDVHDRWTLRAPHRENQRFVEAVAQFALERNGIPQRLI